MIVSESLAVKYRPTTLDDVVGQKAVCDSIRGMVARRNLPNALLISGDTGSGKTTLSRIIARIVNCQDLQGSTPCGKCASCSLGENPDFIEMNIGDSRGIDSIRALQQQAQYLPRFNIRIFLLDECHQLTKAGASCLLKLLEEPPTNTVFILATTDPEKMLNTVIGRCVKLNLRRLLPKDILPYLAKVCRAERIKFGSKEAMKKCLSQIVDATGGQPRDSLQLLEGVANTLASGNDVDVLKTFSEQFDVSGSVRAIKVLVGMYNDDAKAVAANSSISALHKMIEFQTCGIEYLLGIPLDFVSYDRRNYLSALKKANPHIDDMVDILNILIDIKKEFTTFTIEDKSLLLARLLR